MTLCGKSFVKLEGGLRY